LDFGDISYSPDLPADERGIIGYEFKITLGAKAYKTESGGEEIFYEALTPLRSITKNSLRTFGQALEELKSDEEINNLLNELVPERWSIAYRDQYSWVTDEIIIKVDNAEETVEVSEKIIIDPHGFPGSDILALDDGPFIDNSPGWVTKILMNGELSLMLTLLLSNLEKKISPAIQQYNQDSEPIIEIYGDAGGPQVESKIKLILAANDPAKDFTKLAKYIIFKTWECTE
jgi:hypothetical protein